MECDCAPLTIIEIAACTSSSCSVKVLIAIKKGPADFSTGPQVPFDKVFGYRFVSIIDDRK